LSIKNDLATEQFRYGEEYEVTFRRVVKPALGDGHPIVRAITKTGEIVCETCGHTLGWTEEGLRHYGDHMRQYMTDEYAAEMVAHHDEVYRSADTEPARG
jgi:hypothetical protein